MAKSKFIRRLGWIVLVLAGLLLLAATGLYAIGDYRLGYRYGSAPVLTGSDVAKGDPRHGERLSHTLGCVDCHGQGLAGAEVFDAPPARVVAPNLTRGEGGVGAAYGATDFDRAVRFGIRPDRSALVEVMPSGLYHGLSDADMADLSAYLAALPPRNHRIGATVIRPLGKVLVGAGLVQMQVPRPHATRAQAAATSSDGPVAFGRYLASVTCVECHGADLAGGRHPAPQAPPAPSLMHVALWQPADLAGVFSSGKVGQRALTDWMPTVDAFDHFDEAEVAALHAYIQSLANPRPAELDDTPVTASAASAER